MIKRVLPKIISLSLLTTIILLTASCGNTENPSPDTGNSSKITIGLSMATLREERWQKDTDILVAKAKAKGAEVIVQNANNSLDDQISQVKYLLDQNIDILMIVPQDADKTIEAVELAKKKGIKVICYDRLIKNASVDYYISFDNILVGEGIASTIVSKVPTGNYLIINGAPTDNNSFMYNTGIKNILQPYIDNGSIKLLDEAWAEDWRPEDSFKFVEKALQNNEHIDAVVAANDNLAGAAIEALAEKQLAGIVMVGGHDADISGCQRVAEGTQCVTVYKPIEQLASKAIDVAIGLIENGSYGANSYIYDGKYSIPFQKITPIVVTKENLMDTVIKSGFHRMEDVYLNVPRSQWPTAK